MVLDEEGVCSGCRVHEEKDVLPWGQRMEKLGRIVDGYRNRSGNTYDCIIPVRGGGDSYFIVYVVTKILKLNPLLVTYNHEYNTKVGIRNLANLLTVFDCDHVTYTLDPALIKRLTLHSLKKHGSMYWHVLAGSLTFPVQVAVRFKIPLIVWGVNGWADQVGMYSHLDEVEMTKKVRKEHSLMGIDAEDMVDVSQGISRRDVQPFIYPYDDVLEKVGVRGIYLSNYIRWDSKKQHELMIEKYGYETAIQSRTFNTYEDADCFHSAGTHDYIKYLKYGFGKATDHATREIRLKRMTREEGIAMVRRYDGVRPPDLDLFLKNFGITEQQLESYISPFRDQRIWQKGKDSTWMLKDSVVNHEQDAGVDRVRLLKLEDCVFQVTPSREPQEKEDEYVLMGRGYIDEKNFQALKDDQDAIEADLSRRKAQIAERLRAQLDDRVDPMEQEPSSLVYCSRCVMPNTKPGVVLDEEGVCSACRSVEKKQHIDWNARATEFKGLCDVLRGSNGNGYDCLVPVSGGKDSQYQVWRMKYQQGMHVLGVCVVPHLQTREGIANINAMVREYGIDFIKIALKPSVFKAIRRRAFFEMGEPNWADHSSVMAGATRIAYLYQIPLIVWGEDVAVEFGGTTSNKPKASAADIIKSDLFGKKTIANFYNDQVTSANTFFYKYPSDDDWQRRKIQSVYIGYFFFWDGFENFILSRKFGFQARRLGSLSGNTLAYDNIDEKQCEINIWFKFLKFGFWRPTDQSCYHIWNRRLSRDAAVEQVNARQYEFPAEYLNDFLRFNSITFDEFWCVVDKFRNRKIWRRVDGEWRLKTSLIGNGTSGNR
jgi:N-acetyl sugar amidotransferase